MHRTWSVSRDACGFVTQPRLDMVGRQRDEFFTAVQTRCRPIALEPWSKLLRRG